MHLLIICLQSAFYKRNQKKYNFSRTNTLNKLVVFHISRFFSIRYLFNSQDFQNILLNIWHVFAEMFWRKYL